MSKNTKTAIVSITMFLIFAVVVFMLTSLVMASVNDRSLTDEWKSWVNTEEVVEDTTEDTTENEDEVVDEQLTADYTDIVILA